MKKKVLVFLLLTAMVFALGNVLTTKDYTWSPVGETTTAYTTPAVNERDYTNLTANHTDAVVFTLTPYRWNVIGLRFIVDDDGDDTVFDVFASKGITDHFTRIATLTIKGGTQVGPDTSTDSSAVFCDTITVTNSFWVSTITVVDGGGADRMSTIYWDMAGYNTWALVGTTVDDTTLVQATGY